MKLTVLLCLYLTYLLSIYPPNEYDNYERWYTIPPHRTYLCSLNELYFLLYASSAHNFLKPEKATVKRQLYSGKVPSFLTFVATKRQYLSFLQKKSVFDRRPLRTNIRKYANFIPLFSSHCTVRTITRT